MLVRGSGLGLEAFTIPTPPRDYWGEQVLGGQVEGVCVGGWATGRLKPLEAKIVTIKAKPCTGNAGRSDIPTRQGGAHCVG